MSAGCIDGWFSGQPRMTKERPGHEVCEWIMWKMSRRMHESLWCQTSLFSLQLCKNDTKFSTIQLTVSDITISLTVWLIVVLFLGQGGVHHLTIATAKWPSASFSVKRRGIFDAQTIRSVHSDQNSSSLLDHDFSLILIFNEFFDCTDFCDFFWDTPQQSNSCGRSDRVNHWQFGLCHNKLTIHTVPCLSRWLLNAKLLRHPTSLVIVLGWWEMTGATSIQNGHKQVIEAHNDFGKDNGFR